MRVQSTLASVALIAAFSSSPFYQASDLRAQCTPTSKDLEIADYREGAPERTQFYSSPEGTPLRVAGAIQTHACVPAVGAVVEIWSATPEGCYSGANGCDDRGDSYFLRGTMTSDDQGKFTILTLFPGKHEVNGKLRPAHINFRIKHGNADLITQVYFDGDELIANDPSAGSPEAAERILFVLQEGPEKTVIFNVVLPEVSAVNERSEKEIGVYPTVFKDKITISGLEGRAGSAEISDATGKVLLSTSSIHSAPFSGAALAKLAPGSYFLSIVLDSRSYSYKLQKL